MKILRMYMIETGENDADRTDRGVSGDSRCIVFFYCGKETVYNAADDQPSDQCTGRRMGIKIIYPDEQRASSDAGRYDHAGKLRWDLLPLEEIEDIVKVYKVTTMYGAKDESEFSFDELTEYTVKYESDTSHITAAFKESKE